MDLLLHDQKCRLVAGGLIGLALALLFGSCARVPLSAIAITATPLRQNLVATFTPTSQPTATETLPSVTPAPADTRPAQKTLTPSAPPTASFITWDEAGTYVGVEITLCGPVMGAYFATDSKGQPTFLNIGEQYPHPDRFTVVIWAQDRHKFSTKPEELYLDQEICVTGTIEAYNGALEIVVTEPGQITIQ